MKTPQKRNASFDCWPCPSYPLATPLLSLPLSLLSPFLSPSSLLALPLLPPNSLSPRLIIASCRRWSLHLAVTFCRRVMLSHFVVTFSRRVNSWCRASSSHQHDFMCLVALMWRLSIALLHCVLASSSHCVATSRLVLSHCCVPSVMTHHRISFTAVA